MKPSRNKLGWGRVWRWIAVTFIIEAIIVTVNNIMIIAVVITKL